VWTGSRMIVWGGYNGYGTGGIYDPATDSWAPVSTTGAPSGRVYHTAVWTGSRMIVWGGEISTSPSTAGSTTRRPTPGRPPAPRARRAGARATPRCGPALG
jgi:hypothetical protein